jgi:Villin headpiece domain
MEPATFTATRDQRRANAVRGACLASNAVFLAAVSFTQTAGLRKLLRRQTTLHRIRPSFASIFCYLSAEEFTSCFRMPREAFQELLTILKSNLARDARSVECGSVTLLSLVLSIRVTL